MAGHCGHCSMLAHNRLLQPPVVVEVKEDESAGHLQVVDPLDEVVLEAEQQSSRIIAASTFVCLPLLLNQSKTVFRCLSHFSFGTDISVGAHFS